MAMCMALSLNCQAQLLLIIPYIFFRTIKPGPFDQCYLKGFASFKNPGVNISCIRELEADRLQEVSEEFLGIFGGKPNAHVTQTFEPYSLVIDKMTVIREPYHTFRNRSELLSRSCQKRI